MLDDFICDAREGRDVPDNVRRGVPERFSVDDECLESAQLALFVLRTGDVESAKAFYQSFGAKFVMEQHGSAPLHYSAKLGDVVIELYPRTADEPSARLRFGFRVTSVEQATETVRRRGAKVVSEPRQSAWGMRAVVEDPDGNYVEILSTNP